MRTLLFSAAMLVWILDLGATELAPSASLFDLSLEDLINLEVTTPSRVHEKLDAAPGVTHVITRETIRRRGYSSLKDLLQTIPGFAVFHRDLDFVGTVRGLTANDNEKFSLLINGEESNLIHEPDFLNGPINLDTVERVEVIIGPSSLFQQANTLAATVNVITRQAEGVEVAVGKGTDLDYSTSIMAGKKWDERRWISSSFTLERRLGFDAWDRQASPAPLSALEGEELTGASDESFFLVLNGQNGDWSAQLISYQSRFPELQLEGNGYDNSWYTDKMHGLTLKNEHRLTEALTTIASLGVAYKRTTRLIDEGAAIAGVEQSVAQYDWKGELGLIYSGLEKHLVQAGLQLAYEDNFDAYWVYDSTKRTLYEDDTRAFGLYLADTYQVSDRLTLVGGLRADQNTLVGGHWYPGGRLAVIHKATDRWTTKVMFNRAVRMPSPLAALNSVAGTEGSDPPDWADDWPTAERPEILSTLEWQNIFYLPQTRLELTVYHQELKDYISWAGPHSNTGDFSGNGLEVDVQHPATEKLTLWGNVSYVDAKFEAFGTGGEALHARVDTDDRLIGAPTLTANIGFDYDLTRRVLFSSTLRYFTGQSAKAVPGAPNDDPDSFERIRNQFFWDASLTCKDVFRKGMDIRIAAKNMLNNRDLIAGSWLDGQYRPRGASLEIKVYLEF